MDLLYKNWEREDTEYAPKRKVDNKISWVKPHIIGSFYSDKMDRVVEYHSLNECFFYYLLELDENVARYYVQPVFVPVCHKNQQGYIRKWVHVPDVLVFRQGCAPILFQIKEPKVEPSATFDSCNKACAKFSAANEWKYKVIYPKLLPETVLSNLEFLAGFLKKRKTYEKWTSELLLKLKCIGPSTIEDLAKSFVPKTDHREILPLVYHLISRNKLHVNINKQLDQFSIVSINANKPISSDLYLGVNYYES